MTVCQAVNMGLASSSPIKAVVPSTKQSMSGCCSFLLRVVEGLDLRFSAVLPVALNDCTLEGEPPSFCTDKCFKTRRKMAGRHCRQVESCQVQGKARSRAHRSASAHGSVQVTYLSTTSTNHSGPRGWDSDIEDNLIYKHSSTVSNRPSHLSPNMPMYSWARGIRWVTHGAYLEDLSW